MGTTFIPIVFFIIYFFIKAFDMKEYEKKTEKKDWGLTSIFFYICSQICLNNFT